MPPDFISDGCTGFFQSWRGIDLRPCCEAHDLAWFLHPSDWGRWFASNIDLGVCFYGVGAWELSALAVIAVCSPIGVLLFARTRKR